MDNEIICKAVHEAYCNERVRQGKEPYWTGGDYDKLDEATKNYDRATVRAVLKAINFQRLQTEVKQQAKAGESNPMSQTYDYSFCIWPHNNWKFTKGVFEVFECLKGRIEFVWTPRHFEKVRSELSRIGLVMHEISRCPHYEEEAIL